MKRVNKLHRTFTTTLLFVICLSLLVCGCKLNGPLKSKNVSLPQPDRITYGGREITTHKEEILKNCFEKFNLNHRINFSEITANMEPLMQRYYCIILEYKRPQTIQIKYDDKYTIDYKITRVHIGFKKSAGHVIYLEHPAEIKDKRVVTADKHTVTTLFVEDSKRNDAINSRIEEILKRMQR
ncbi:hypothetical protein [Desulfofundulus kuznetsovii]